jgi:hypothetical protein
VAEIHNRLSDYSRCKKLELVAEFICYLYRLHLQILASLPIAIRARSKTPALTAFMQAQKAPLTPNTILRELLPPFPCIPNENPKLGVPADHILTLMRRREVSFSRSCPSSLYLERVYTAAHYLKAS